jgi:hypothetical protein
MSAHTPAPWHYQQVGSPGYFVIKGPNGSLLPSTLENARLQAAAPDMAAALRALQTVDRLNVAEWSAAMRAVDAALAKAGL